MKTISKKLISLILCAVIIFGTISVGGVIDFKAFAASGSCGDNLIWEFDEDSGELVISGTGAMTDYTYSSNAPWYSYEYKITKVTISDSVTSIGNRAFWDCESLTSITISDSVTSIDKYAFGYCESLKTVYYTGTPTQWSEISKSYDYSNLTSATIIYECNSSKLYLYSGSCGENFSWILLSTGELVISGIGAMDDYSSSDTPWYSYKDKITKVTIEDSVTSIGGYAFRDCTSLTSITIGDSVTSIVGNAFYNTGYYNNKDNWQNGVLYIGNCLIEAKDTISGDYKIKDGTKVIANDSFSGCTSLTSITIPDSVTSIGGNAFYNTGYYNDISKW